MKKIKMSVEDLYSLEPFNISHANVSKMLLSSGPHIIKRLEGSRAYNDNVIYTVEELHNQRDILPIEFCIPDGLVETEDGIEAITVPEVLDSSSLGYVLSSWEFSHQQKIEYLKKFGALLRRCDELRKKRHMHNFAICDVQEENILVVPKKNEIRVIDMDTCRIGSGLSSQAKYLTPYSLAMYVPSKYHNRSHFGYVAANRDSDLFCYIIIILNYLAGQNIANISLEDFYYYIDHLDFLGFNHELLSIFASIVAPGQNSNPDYLLDTIDEKVISKCRHYN